VDAIDIEIQYFDGCPNWQAVDSMVRSILDESGTSAEVRLTRVGGDDEAERLSFRGSPTVLINGADPWVSRGAPVGFSCRVYRTEEGLAGSPSASQLREAIESAKGS
jgi:hypothetical protein